MGKVKEKKTRIFPGSSPEDGVNKQQGFLDLMTLSEAGLPCPYIMPLRRMDDVQLDSGKLYSLRASASCVGNTHHPDGGERHRCIGITVDEVQKAVGLMDFKSGNPYALHCHEYFVAEKRGVLKIFGSKCEIKAVTGNFEVDREHLSKYYDMMIVRHDNGTEEQDIRREVLSRAEIDEILSHVPLIKRHYDGRITSDDKYLQLSWGYVTGADLARRPVFDGCGQYNQHRLSFFKLQRKSLNKE